MDLSLLIQGTMSVLADPLTILFIVVGVFVGIIFGAVPGLTATLAVIMFLPVTYTMTSVQGLSTLIALYVGGISGGLVAAILLNIPGTPSSIATTFDGAPLAAKGEAGKALGVGVVFSFVGTIFGLIMLVTISPALASVAIQFGAFGYCAVAACALALVISLAGRDLVKGLMGAFFGLMIATAGLSPVDSMKRFTFGLSELTSGFALLTILIGLFAITEVAKAAEDVRKKQDMRVETNVKIKGFGFTLAEFFGQKWNALRSSVIGCIMAFGVIGYGMVKAGIPSVPVIMGIILGPIFEMNFRRVAQLQGSGEGLLDHPIAAFLTLVAVAALIFSFVMNRREAKKLAQAEAASTAEK